MTTSDKATIEDGGVHFWKISESDLFGLADNQGHVVAAYATNISDAGQLAADLGQLFKTPTPRYLVSSDRLYACSVRPLYFGREKDGILLGYVISGFFIGPDLLKQISQATAVEAAFLSQGRPLASTLDESDGAPDGDHHDRGRTRSRCARHVETWKRTLHRCHARPYDKRTCATSAGGHEVF